MKIPKLSSFLQFAACFRRSHAGAIAPVAAVVASVLVLGTGVGVDLSRVVMLRTTLQDAADSAALAGAAQSSSSDAVTAATAYVAAAAGGLSGSPKVTAAYAYDNTTSATAPTMSVTLTASIPTTLMSIVTSKLSSTVSAKASGTLARNVVMTLNNFNSSASDLDQVYYYISSSSLTGSSLYTWTPTLVSSNMILSNSPSNTLASSVTFQVGLTDAVGFALANTTGGVSSYGSNCYGQKQGATVYYYSHRLDTAGAYHDYPSVAFKSCGYTLNSSSTLSPCSSTRTSNCTNNASFAAANYTYASSYSRNPLEITTTNRDCTQGTVTYAFDDNGGSTDDNDYNDAVFSVSCTTTSVGKNTVKLIS